MKLIALTLIVCGLAVFLLSVRVIFSKSHKFLSGHACKGAHHGGNTPAQGKASGSR